MADWHPYCCWFPASHEIWQRIRSSDSIKWKRTFSSGWSDQRPLFDHCDPSSQSGRECRGWDRDGEEGPEHQRLSFACFCCRPPQQLQKEDDVHILLMSFKCLQRCTACTSNGRQQWEQGQRQKRMDWIELTWREMGIESNRMMNQRIKRKRRDDEKRKTTAKIDEPFAKSLFPAPLFIFSLLLPIPELSLWLSTSHPLLYHKYFSRRQRHEVLISTRVPNLQSPGCRNKLCTKRQRPRQRRLLPLLFWRSHQIHARARGHWVVYLVSHDAWDVCPELRLHSCTQSNDHHMISGATLKHLSHPSPDIYSNIILPSLTEVQHLIFSPSPSDVRGGHIFETVKNIRHHAPDYSWLKVINRSVIRKVVPWGSSSFHAVVWVNRGDGCVCAAFSHLMK